MSSDSYWRSLGRRRVSRRALLQAGAATGAGVAGLAVAACGGGDEASVPATPRVPTGTAGAGGTVVTGVRNAPLFGLDPHTEVSTGLRIFPKVYGYLLHQDPRNETIIPDHAQVREQPDELTYIVELKPGIRYQDLPPVNGREVLAEDVFASIERLTDNPLASDKTWYTEILESMEATDDRTLVFKNSRPYVYTWESLGAINSAIIPRELADSSRVDLGATGVGSGPFMIDRVSLEEQIELVRNPDYFNQPLPYLDRQTWRVVVDDAARVAAFKDQQVHLMASRDKPEIEDLASFSEDARTFSGPSLKYVSLGMRVDRPPFNDARVREAIDVGLDRGQFIDELSGGDGEILGPVNPHLADGFWALTADELAEAYQSDLGPEERTQQARDLLSAAGALGTKISVQSDSRQSSIDVATLMRDQLARIGFEVELEVLDLRNWYLDLRQGDFHATVIDHLPYESPDIPTRWYYSRGVSDGGNWFGYASSAVDDLIVASWGQFDRDERQATLLEAQRLMLQERGPMLNLYSGVDYSAAWGFVRNWRPELPGSLAAYNYEYWLDR